MRNHKEVARKKKSEGPKAPIMRKAKIHSNEDLKSYSRKQTRKDEREAKDADK